MSQLRASYVNGPELLTPIGEWLAKRLPHVEAHRSPMMDCWRLYGGRPYVRLCIFDFTRTSFYRSQPKHIRVRVCGWTVYGRMSRG